jgi:hypothetical protein
LTTPALSDSISFQLHRFDDAERVADLDGSPTSTNGRAATPLRRFRPGLDLVPSDSTGTGASRRPPRPDSGAGSEPAPDGQRRGYATARDAHPSSPLDFEPAIPNFDKFDHVLSCKSMPPRPQYLRLTPPYYLNSIGAPFASRVWRRLANCPAMTKMKHCRVASSRNDSRGAPHAVRRPRQEPPPPDIWAGDPQPQVGRRTGFCQPIRSNQTDEDSATIGYGPNGLDASG